MKWFRKSSAPVATENKGLADPDASLLAIFGASGATTVTTDEALRVPAVAAAVRLIAEAAACLDVTIRSKDDKGEDHPAKSLLSTQANDWTDSYSFIRDLLIDALVFDRGGMAYVNRVDGRPVELVRYAPGVLTVEYDPVTNEPSYKRGQNPEPAANVIHLRAPFGNAPLSLAKEAVAASVAMSRHASNLFANGARPSGALIFPKGMGEESVKKARSAWRATHEGKDSGGKTAILYDGAEYKPFALASTDAQFIENRRFQVIEIARAFRVPPTMLFDLERATWSNSEQMGREFLTFCLEPWLKALEGALNRGLLLPEEREDYAVRFDRDDLTRADLTSRATAINSLIASRVLNANEGRSWLDLPSYAGGDTFSNPNIDTSNKEVPS